MRESCRECACKHAERLKLQKNRDYEMPFADLITAICGETGG